MMMDIRALHTEADYEWALKEVEAYFENMPKPGSDAADRFDVLSALIEDYDRKHHEIPDADPVEILHFAIDSLGKSQAELAKIIGRSRASEVLSRKRHLTLDMIRAISAAWNLPIEPLTASYALQKQQA